MFRHLSQKETDTLERNGCICQNWEQVEVKDPFMPERIKNVTFSGNIKIGANKGDTPLDDQILKPSGINDCFIHNCTLGDDVYLAHIGTLANYVIGNQTVIEYVDTLKVSGKTSFGNGHLIDILNEGGGRELPIFNRLSAQIAYMLVIYRHDRSLTEKLKSIILQYARSLESSVGKVGNYCRITGSKTIINVTFGDHCTIRGASLLEEGEVSGNASAPVFIGENVCAKNFMVLSDSRIEGGAILDSTFVGQGVRIGKQFSAENSAFFANSEGFHGEACSIFAGPYTVTHHKSTLLIAGLFSFYNAGSGTNQSNHMYKLGPVHQGLVERGSKTGSFSYMLWPCRVGAFSVVMDKHAGNFDTSELPFSYISVEKGKSLLTPAMNLFTVGTARDNKKWPARDRRKDPDKLDLIHFPFLNPYTVQKILTGIECLSTLHDNTPKTREFATYKGVTINRLMLRTSRRYYELALSVYLTQNLVSRLENNSYNNMTEVRERLLPHNAARKTQWVDMAGMIAEKPAVENLSAEITSGKINTPDELHDTLRKIYTAFTENEWAWCTWLFREWKKIDPEKLTKDQLMQILEEWKINTIKFNNMILKDAEKEFDQLSHIGFGPDGNEEEKQADFENIRGKYETTRFIVDVKKESEEIQKKYEKLREKLNQLPD